MGNQSSSGANGGSSELMVDNLELFRRQSIRKSSVGYAAFSTNLTRAKRFMERELNKSHSLHDLDFNGSTAAITGTKAAAAKNRRQSTANDASFTARKRSTVARFNGIAADASANNSNCASRTSPAPFGDTQEDQYINGFGSTMSSLSPTSGGSHHSRTASTPSLSATGGGSATRQKSMKRSEAQQHPISVSGREIIQFCFENAPLDFGSRLCTRIYEKRADYQRFSQQMGRERWHEMTHALREFLQRVIAKIDNLEAVEKMARKYGEDHLPLKSFGFKPDFWVTLADLLTVEGVMLDQATHTHTEAVTAWSLFISILFSSIRDGYYSAMREQRNSVRKRSSARQTSLGAVPGCDPASVGSFSGLQQLQIPSSDGSCVGGGGGGFSASGSSSPVDAVGGSGGRTSRGSSVRVAGGGSRKSSATLDPYVRRQSPHR